MTLLASGQQTSLVKALGGKAVVDMTQDINYLIATKIMTPKYKKEPLLMSEATLEACLIVADYAHIEQVLGYQRSGCQQDIGAPETGHHQHHHHQFWG
ncbi:hypothetical protein DFQ26_009076 [Actinomortierella ambigua]|nr:hypothetical protein DFQ26_009076 [Actinomortierella ambigua]